MQLINATDAIALTLAELKAGDFFIYNKKDVAVVTKKGDGEIFFVVLSGKDGGTVRGGKVAGNSCVVKIGIKSVSVKLRIDLSSVIAADRIETPGIVVFCAGAGPILTLGYFDDPFPNHRRGLNVKSWSEIKVRTPSHAYSRWSLGYVDEASQWADLGP